MKKYSKVLIIVLLMGALTSCGQAKPVEYVNMDDISVGDDVSKISFLEEGDDPFEITFEEVIDMMDKYVKIKGKNLVRGTNEYAHYIYDEVLFDKDVQALKEWPAILEFGNVYDVEGGIEFYDLDENKLLPEMTGKTIREFCLGREMTPEESYENTMVWVREMESKQK